MQVLLQGTLKILDDFQKRILKRQQRILLLIIEKFKNELRRLGINPQRTILYGSYARGDQKEYSDIDIIVISDDFKDMNLRERLEILGLAGGRILEPVEALGYTEDEVEHSKEGFLEEVLKSPSVVY